MHGHKINAQACIGGSPGTMKKLVSSALTPAFKAGQEFL
jgi:hypothetical protein